MTARRAIRSWSEFESWNAISAYPRLVPISRRHEMMSDSRAGIWIGAARPRTLPAAFAPVVVGTALACHDGKFIGAAAVLCLGFSVLVQIGTNFANDYYDFIRGADNAARV